MKLVTEDFKLHCRDEISEIQIEGNYRVTTQVLANKSLEKNMGKTEGEKSTQWLLSTWGDSA